MIQVVLIALEVIVCIALIAAVMLQSGKGGGGLGSTFGGNDGGFLGKGNDLDTVLAKATIVLGGLFAAITLALAKLNA